MQIAAYNPTPAQIAAEWTGERQQAEKPALQMQAARTFYQGSGQIAPRSFGRKGAR